jgi:hypothetical protein
MTLSKAYSFPGARSLGLSRGLKGPEKKLFLEMRGTVRSLKKVEGYELPLENARLVRYSEKGTNLYLHHAPQGIGQVHFPYSMSTQGNCLYEKNREFVMEYHKADGGLMRASYPKPLKDPQLYSTIQMNRATQNPFERSSGNRVLTLHQPSLSPELKKASHWAIDFKRASVPDDLRVQVASKQEGASLFPSKPVREPMVFPAYLSTVIKALGLQVFKNAHTTNINGVLGRIIAGRQWQWVPESFEPLITEIEEKVPAKLILNI